VTMMNCWGIEVPFDNIGLVLLMNLSTLRDDAQDTELKCNSQYLTISKDVLRFAEGRIMVSSIPHHQAFLSLHLPRSVLSTQHLIHQRRMTP